MKNTWRILNNVIQKKVTKQEFPDTFQESNKIIRNKKQIANRFNKYFASIGPELPKEIDKPTGDENFICICKTAIQNPCL